MNHKLSLQEKKEIVIEYGSNIRSINKILKVLNTLDILDDEADLYELVCLIAQEVEANKILKETKSSMAHKNLAEIIAITIWEKYEYLDELSPQKQARAKIFINHTYPGIIK